MPLIIPEFITEEERDTLMTWEEQIRPDLSRLGVGQGCNFQRHECLPFTPPVFHDIRHRIQSLMEVTDGQEERNYGWYLSSTVTNGYIAPHTDYIDNSTYHLRCNLFVHAPEHGGMPIIEGKEYCVASRSLLCFFPCYQRHSTTPVLDFCRRIVCSYGYEVDCDFFIAKYEAWR